MKIQPFINARQFGALIRQATGNNRIEWQQVNTFLIVCIAGGTTTMQHIERNLGLAQSSVSRNVSKLAHGESPSRPGPNLLETFDDPADRRQKIVRLTKQGEHLAADIAALMGQA